MTHCTSDMHNKNDISVERIIYTRHECVNSQCRHRGRMAYKEEVAGRLYLAFDQMRSAARARRETFGQKELAEGIAAILGGEPPNQSVVSRWMAKEEPSLPENPVLEAAAQVLGVRELWLLLGKGPMRESNQTLDVSVPPLDMFREMTTGDDLRRALGEPEKGKKRKGNG